jgi:hypothetical protein
MMPEISQKSPKRPHFGDFLAPQKQPNAIKADLRKTEFGPGQTQLHADQRAPKSMQNPSSRALPTGIRKNIDKSQQNTPPECSNVFQEDPKVVPKMDQEGPMRPKKTPKGQTFAQIDFGSGFRTQKATEPHGTAAEAGVPSH